MWKVAVVLVLGCSSPAKQGPVEKPTPVEPEPKQAPPPDPEPIKQPPPPHDLGQPTNADLESPQRPTVKGTQLAIAWQKNADGITAMTASKYAEASASFRDAVARVPDPPYFFNLCVSLYWEGKFGEALTACDAVGKNSPSAGLQTKTETMNARIKNEAARQEIKVQP